MPADKLAVSQAARKLEKELLNSNRLLASKKELEQSLKQVLELAGFLEEQSDQDAVFTSFFKQTANLRLLISQFKELEQKLGELSRSLQEIEEARVKADLFFENFRDYRTYYFQEASKALEFIKQAFDLYSFEKAFFKPQFSGSIDLGRAISDFELRKEANSSFKVKSENLASFLQHLLERNLLKKSRLDNEGLRILFQNSNELFVEAENAKIRRLDRLCKQLEGDYWEQ
ncbi:MAG TPA: hypothetical protein HA222_03615 [Candidatus Diapherotrites archaeon]|uniref:Uncharacterized protein n=1 Tax=Candidatus Iainarchaeum sp. TaxID=3101447 RepID=A0A7J4K2J0_9ARCH|nr:hypothetical protein [Candidatus Diapherotrites archaeon]